MWHGRGRQAYTHIRLLLSLSILYNSWAQNNMHTHLNWKSQICSRLWEQCMMMIKKETWKIQVTVSGKSLASETRKFLVGHHEWTKIKMLDMSQPIMPLETVILVLYHKPALISRKKDSCLARQKQSPLFLLSTFLHVVCHAQNTTHTHAYNHTYRHTHYHAYNYHQPRVVKLSCLEVVLCVETR